MKHHDRINAHELNTQIMRWHISNTIQFSVCFFQNHFPLQPGGEALSRILGFFPLFLSSFIKVKPPTHYILAFVSLISYKALCTCSLLKILFFTPHYASKIHPCFMHGCTSFTSTGYNIPLCEYTLFCLSVFLLMEVFVVHSLWLLSAVLPWAFLSGCHYARCDLFCERGVALLETVSVHYESFNGYTVQTILWNVPIVLQSTVKHLLSHQ